jgi:hypothetical protein
MDASPAYLAAGGYRLAFLCTASSWPKKILQKLARREHPLSALQQRLSGRQALRQELPGLHGLRPQVQNPSSGATSPAKISRSANSRSRSVLASVLPQTRCAADHERIAARRMIVRRPKDPEAGHDFEIACDPD